MWTGAILAGGQSRRLGGLNKANLILESPAAETPEGLRGTTVLARQLERLARVVDRTIIVANKREEFSQAGVPVIPDIEPGAGAIGALYTAVHSSSTSRTLVIACDMPFVSEALLRHLVRAGEQADIAIPRTSRGYEPLCATYSRRSAAAIKRLIEEKRLKLSDVALIPDLRIIEIGSEELAAFGHEDELFFNINTPEDYRRAIELDGEYRSLRG
jgi:molybdenum cofactor guanylyltransferase